MENLFKKLFALIVIVGVLAVGSIFVAIVLSFAGGDVLETGNVAVIPITGVISTSSDSWSDTVDPVFVRQAIEEAENDDSIKAIVFEINTPGGSAVASDEISQAIKRTSKPTVSWIREVGASGGYWIASNTDHIIANRMSITGSVGVTASYLEFGGTLERYNASYEQVTGGKYKELGTPWREPTPEEKALLQKKVDRIHEYFLSEVQTNRNLTNATMQKVRTGEFFLGVEAYDLGLVDELGSFPEVDAYLNATIGEAPQYVHYSQPRSFWQELALVKTQFLPGLETGAAIRT